MKEFGLPSTSVLGEGANLQFRANFFNAFNKLNLAPFTFGRNSTVISYGPTVNSVTQFPVRRSGGRIGWAGGRT